MRKQRSEPSRSRAAKAFAKNRRLALALSPRR
jgi:hypothetical protein